MGGRAASQVPSSAVGPHSCLFFVPESDGIRRLERVRIDDNWPLRVVSRLCSAWATLAEYLKPSVTALRCELQISHSPRHVPMGSVEWAGPGGRARFSTWAIEIFEGKVGPYCETSDTRQGIFIVGFFLFSFFGFFFLGKKY